MFCSSRRQCRDYIIDLYGVKDSTTSNSKCAMISLSCLLSFYTIPISLFFEFEEFLCSSLPSFFMHACICKVQWIYRRQGAEAPKKITILADNGNVGLRDVCVQSFMITHTQCFMVIVKYKVIFFM